MIFPTPVLVVGSYDKAGKPNAMTVAWGGDMLLAAALCRDLTEKGNV